MNTYVDPDQSYPPEIHRVSSYIHRLTALAAVFLSGAASAAQAALDAPTNVRVTNHDAVSVQVAWDSTAPPDGYSEFSVYANGFLVYITSATSAQFSGLTPGETYQLTVTVKRFDVPESPPSVPVTLTMDSDNVPPATPGGFTLVQRNPPSALTFTWDWTEDNTGTVPGWELTYAGRTVLINHTYPGHTQSVSDLDLQPGNSYTFELHAIDAAGNRSLEPARFVFETTPPSQPTNLRQISTRESFPDIIEWDAAMDNSNRLRSHEVFVNGRSVGFTGSAANRAGLFDLVVYSAPSGQAAVQVRALDPSLNPSELSPPLVVIFP